MGDTNRLHLFFFRCCLHFTCAHQLLWFSNQHALECSCLLLVVSLFYRILFSHRLSMRKSYLIHLNNGACLESVSDLLHKLKHLCTDVCKQDLRTEFYFHFFSRKMKIKTIQFIKFQLCTYAII